MRWHRWFCFLTFTLYISLWVHLFYSISFTSIANSAFFKTNIPLNRSFKITQVSSFEINRKQSKVGSFLSCKISCIISISCLIVGNFLLWDKIFLKHFSTFFLLSHLALSICSSWNLIFSRLIICRSIILPW